MAGEGRGLRALGGKSRRLARPDPRALERVANPHPRARYLVRFTQTLERQAGWAWALFSAVRKLGP